MPTICRDRTTSWSSSRAPSPACSDRDTNTKDGSLATTIVVPKDLITVPLDVDMNTISEGNLSTPCADAPLIPQLETAPKNTILEALAQGLKQLNDNFSGKFDLLAS